MDTTSHFSMRRRYYPLLQFLPLKLAEWVAKNLADELDLPDYGDDLESADLNLILTQCLPLPGIEQKRQ
jgi:hypothetical protein